MGDRTVVMVAICAAAMALRADSVPSSLCVAALCLSVLGLSVLGVSASTGTAAVPGSGRSALNVVAHRRVIGVVVGVVVVSCVGLRAQQDLAGLSRAVPSRMDAEAQLGSDPQPGPFGASVELVANGRRWAARIARADDAVIRDLMTGDRVHVVARTGPLRTAPRGWVRSRHLAGRLTVDSIEHSGPPRPWFTAANVVHRLLARGAGSMSAEHRALYLGLVLGDDRGQSEVTRFRFRVAGLTHLLAVSGQNVAFLFTVLGPISRRVTYRWRWVVGITAIVAFTLVTRSEPSVLRASAMAVVALSAAVTGRTVSGLRVLAMAVTAVLLGDPMLVYSVGFQLSVAATVGLVLFTAPLQRVLPGPGWFTAPLAVTLAAQGGAIPVMAMIFGPTSLVAVPANLLAGPAAGGVMTLGLSEGLFAGLVREELAGVLQLPVRVMLWWLDQVAAISSRLSMPPLGLLGWVIVLASAATAIVMWRRAGSTAPGRIMIIGLAPLVVMLRPPSPPLHQQEVEITHGVWIHHDCRGWIVSVQDSGLRTDRGLTDALDGLWHLGVGSAALVEAPASAFRAEDLAGQLGADQRGPPRPNERGSPCSLAR